MAPTPGSLAGRLPGVLNGGGYRCECLSELSNFWDDDRAVDAQL